MLLRNVVFGFVLFCASACAFFCLCFILANTVSAQVVLNEISPAPIIGNEWIELLNIGTTSANLSGWSLEDELTTPSVLATFPANSTLAAGEYRVIEVANKLNNSGDGVRLFNAQHVLQEYSAFASSSAGLSYGRMPNGTGGWQLLQTPSSASANIANPSPSPTSTPFPSPTATTTATATPSPSPSPAATLDPTLQLPQLSEIMACPASGQTEWVELFNPNPQPVTLTNWKIVDAGNHVRTFSLMLTANGHASFLLDPSLLNNTGDQIVLQSPDGVTVDQFQYTSCTSGQSWSLVDGDWTQTDPTQNLPNQSISEDTSSDLHVAETSQDPTRTSSRSASLVANPSKPSASAIAKEWLKKYQWPALPTAPLPSQTNPQETSELPPDTNPSASKPSQLPFPFSSPAYKPILYASALFNTLLAISQLPAAWRWYTEFREQQRIRADPFNLG